MSDRWHPEPLARAILADPDAPIRAVLAAWKCLYHGDPSELTRMAYEAAEPSA